MLNNFLCLVLSALEKNKCLACSLTGPQMGCAGKMVWNYVDLALLSLLIISETP